MFEGFRVKEYQRHNGLMLKIVEPCGIELSIPLFCKKYRLELTPFTLNKKLRDGIPLQEAVVKKVGVNKPHTAVFRPGYILQSMADYGNTIVMADRMTYEELLEFLKTHGYNVKIERKVDQDGEWYLVKEVRDDNDADDRQDH